MSDLLTALESATEGSEALDMLVWQHAGRAIYDHDCAHDEVPAFTTSVDAALTLVPADQAASWAVSRLRSALKDGYRIIGSPKVEAVIVPLDGAP